MQGDTLPAPSDPEVVFTNVSSINLGVVSVNHIKCGYTDENSDGLFVVLAVHGVPGSHYDFRYLATPLGQYGVRVIRINLPGFGPTPKPDDFIYTPTNKANFIANFLQSIGVNKIDMVIGHSMGCTAITPLVATHPNLVSSYGLISSVGTKPHRLYNWLFQFSAPLLDFSSITNTVTSQILHFGYGRLFNLKRIVKDELANGTRMWALLDYTFHTQNLRLIGQKEIPVMLAYALDDNLLESDKFNGISQVLGMKTLNELATTSQPRTTGNVSKNASVIYDVPTNRSRQLVFKDGGHHIQKTRAVAIANSIMQVLNGNKYIIRSLLKR